MITIFMMQDFNPRSSCEERLLCQYLQMLVTIYFNPRPSCEERRYYLHMSVFQQVFQSTLLMRGATSCEVCRAGECNFNPRSSCEERLDRQIRSLIEYISIHAPHARSDVIPLRDIIREMTISIHAPHARSDVRSSHFRAMLHISIHAPHARSDHSLLCNSNFFSISIHAPHARSDLHRYGCLHHCSYFTPRSSCEERLQYLHQSNRQNNFNPRSPCEERRKGEWLCL